MTTKNFSLSLNNGQANVGVALALPAQPVIITVPIPNPISVPTYRPQSMPPPVPRPSGEIEFTNAGTQTFIVPPGVTSITYTGLSPCIVNLSRLF